MEPTLQQIGILRNPVQKYAWGSRTFLQSFLGMPEPWREPAAELWMGGHPKAPSKVRVNGEWRSLIDVIHADPSSVLGKEAAGRFANELPFLLKVLAVERPLSIQVHPHREQASAGYDRENRLNIPLDAPNRNYRDANCKPECLCAVSRFEAMKGFRAPKDILKLMDRVFASYSLPELDLLRGEPNDEGLKRFFTGLVTMESDRRMRMIGEAVKGGERVIDDDRAYYWVRALNREYPGDVGVLSPLFLNLLDLSPGEAIYVPAGELHAYLSGVAMEIMASSDNVLRGGLTHKHVDISELLKNVHFTAAAAEKLRPFPDDNFERIYETPAHEFRLSRIVLKDQETFKSEMKRSVEILLCMKGKGVIKELKSGRTLPLEKGVSVIVPSAVPRYAVSGSVTLYKGTVGTIP
ncbi:MAG: mannose-6-phosphate isomerase, class I [Deltaproteobacteria bacterium]|nr:mannose-6-phosphate isomerase, class I [Deltaproteobacteria bacterium]